MDECTHTRTDMHFVCRDAGNCEDVSVKMYPEARTADGAFRHVHTILQRSTCSARGESTAELPFEQVTAAMLSVPASSLQRNLSTPRLGVSPMSPA